MLKKFIFSCALIIVNTLLLTSQALALMISLVPSSQKIHPPENIAVDIIIFGLHAGVNDNDLPPDVDPNLGPFSVNAFLGGFQFDFFYNSDQLIFLPSASSPSEALGNPDPVVNEAFFNLDFSAPSTIRLLGVSLLEESDERQFPDPDFTCFFCIPPYLVDYQSDSSGTPLDELLLATFVFFAPNNLPGNSIGFDTRNVVLSDPLSNEITLLDSLGNSVFNNSGDLITATDDPLVGFVQTPPISIAVTEPTTLFLLVSSLWGLLRLQRKVKE